MANTRKQNALAGMSEAGAGRCWACAHEGHVQLGAWRAQAKRRYAHTKGFVYNGIWRCRCVLQVVFVEHAQCAEHSTSRRIVCRSSRVLLCSTGLQPLRVSPSPVNQLLRHSARPLRLARPGSVNSIRQCWHAREQENTGWEKQDLRSSRLRWRPRQHPRLDEPASAVGC